ncbi:MAG: tetratricopeptide repeat protein [Kiritimatiellae bacterium]|nr:tetratricopeptide repeat protein [Kiritimatiellia bacterium]
MTVRGFFSGRVGMSVLISLPFLAWYAGLNAWGYHLGESAVTMARTLGAHPFPALDHPIWEMTARALASILPRAAVLPVLSGLCAILAAWSVGLACSFAWRLAEIPGLGSESRWEQHGRKRRRSNTTPKLICRVGGGWAGLILGCHMPVVMAATRPMSAAFDLWLTLLALHATAAAAASRRTFPQLWAAALLGLAVGEHPAAIPLAFIAGIWMLWRMFSKKMIKIPRVTKSREEELRVGLPLACGALILLAGAAPLLIKAGLLRSHPAGVWLGYDTYGQALWDLAVMARSQYLIGWPSQGGLLVLLVTVLPSALVFFAAWGADTRRSMLTMLILLVPMALAGALAFNSRLSPWRLFGLMPLSIWPGLVVALWSGALGAIWARAAWVEWKVVEKPYPSKSKPVPRSLRWAMGWGLPLAVAVLAVAGAIRSRALAHAGGMEPIRDSARAILDEIPPDGWIVTTGGMDDPLRLAVYERRRNVKILNLAQMSQPPLRRYLASAWSADLPLAGLAEYVPHMALIEWLKSDGGKRTRLLHGPELWAAAGLAPVPGVWSYAGLPLPTAAEDAPNVSKEAWLKAGAMQDLARRLGEVPVALEQFALFFRMQLSRMANDHGVQQHAAGDMESARKWYEHAARLCDRNRVATLNLEASSPEKPDVSELIRRFAESNSGLKELDAWILSQSGALSPEVMSSLSRASGGAAADAGQQSPAVRFNLALHWSLAGRGESTVPISPRPDDPAIAVLADVFKLLGEEDFDAAEDALARMREAHASDPLTDMGELMIRAVRNQSEEARRIESSLLARNIPMPTSLAVSLARLDWQEGLTAQAQDRAERILRGDPRCVPALELRLLMAIQTVHQEDAQQGAAALLTVDPHHPLALQTISSFLIERQKYAEAEALLRRAIGRTESSGLLNDLAWVLLRQGRPQEAEPLARRAVESPDAISTYADTLIEVLNALQRSGEADQALADALKKWPDDPDLKARVK